MKPLCLLAGLTILIVALLGADATPMFAQSPVHSACVVDRCEKFATIEERDAWIALVFSSPVVPADGWESPEPGPDIELEDVMLKLVQHERLWPVDEQAGCVVMHTGDVICP